MGEALDSTRYRVIALGRSPERLEALRSRLDEACPSWVDLASPTDISAAFPVVESPAWDR